MRKVVTHRRRCRRSGHGSGLGGAVSGVSQARTVTAADTATPKHDIKWDKCDKDVGDGLPCRRECSVGR